MIGCFFSVLHSLAFLQPAEVLLSPEKARERALAWNFTCLAEGNLLRVENSILIELQEVYLC